MNRKISLGMAISLMAIVATIAIALTYTVAINVFESRMSAIAERQTTNDLTVEIDNKVRQKYFADISEESVRDGIANGIIAGLDDPNCAYFTAQQWELESNRIAGYDFGIGIAVGRTSDGNIIVNRINAGSPAANVLQKGDIITKINGKSVITIGYDTALEVIGDSSSAVEFTVKRSGNTKSVKITKSRYSIVSVDWAMLGKIGRISIHEFNATTPDQFNAALSKLQQNEANGLILDLRDSAGGDYDAACDILDTLLPAGKLMLFTDKNGVQETTRTSDKQCVTLPMCVLINGNTSGASEMFASAIYDYMGNSSMKILGTVGTSTAGLMTVQEDFTLSNGSAVRLTTGRWSTTSGSAIKDGVVVPLYEVKLTSYQQENLYVLDAADDPQIQTAVDLIESRNESDAEAAAATTTTTAESTTTTTTTTAAPATTTTAATTAAAQ